MGLGSQLSGIPSSSVSLSNGLEPRFSSSVSFKPSPSSSVSASLPIPSPSVSIHSLESNGNASTATQTSTIVTFPSQYPSSSVSGSNELVSPSSKVPLPFVSSSISVRPSLSSSRSSTRAGSDVELPVIVSGIPSPSVSLLAEGSSGKSSNSLLTPSPSLSKISQIPSTTIGPSQIPSPSVSAFRGSVSPASTVPFPFASSNVSFKPSPSSSGSSLLPVPSPSVSNHSEGSNGKASGPASHMRTSLIVTETGPSQ